MSPRRSTRTAGKRVPYRPPRDRRELWTAIAVAALIVIVTSTLVWFLRPNRESTGTESTPATVATTPSTDATTTTAPTTTSPPTQDTTAQSGG
jgi:hypothetical protein